MNRISPLILKGHLIFGEESGIGLINQIVKFRGSGKTGNWQSGPRVSGWGALHSKEPPNPVRACLPPSQPSPFMSLCLYSHLSPAFPSKCKVDRLLAKAGGRPHDWHGPKFRLLGYENKFTSENDWTKGSPFQRAGDHWSVSRLLMDRRCVFMEQATIVQLDELCESCLRVQDTPENGSVTHTAPCPALNNFHRTSRVNGGYAFNWSENKAAIVFLKIIWIIVIFTLVVSFRFQVNYLILERVNLASRIRKRVYN